MKNSLSWWYFTGFITLLLVGSFLALCHEYTRNLTYHQVHMQSVSSNADPQRTPQAGDMVSCEDGSVYTIKDASQYQRIPAEPAFVEFLTNAFSASVPKADAIHFTDISGDYLFVKNRYEMYLMLYTLSQSAIEEAEDVLLSIPDDAIPMVQDSWDPEWLLEFQRSHSNKIYCLESWDMYKNGSYQRTVYLAAAI